MTDGEYTEPTLLSPNIGNDILRLRISTKISTAIVSSSLNTYWLPVLFSIISNSSTYRRNRIIYAKRCRSMQNNDGPSRPFILNLHRLFLMLTKLSVTQC